MKKFLLFARGSSLSSSTLAVAFVGCLLVGCLPARKRAVSKQGPAPFGVVVEEVAEGSALREAGLQAGDVLRSWERRPSLPDNSQKVRGSIRSVFDWRWLIVEQAPRGMVRLLGHRQGKAQVFEVAPGEWTAQVRPEMPAAMMAFYDEGRGRVGAGDLESGLGLWKQMIDGAGGEGDENLRCWIRLRTGEVWAGTGDWARAREVAICLQSLGSVAYQRGDLERAADHFQRALEIFQVLIPDNFWVAETLRNLGLLASDRGESGRAIEYLERALRIRRAWAPGSYYETRTSHDLGILYRKLHQPRRALELFRRALRALEIQLGRLGSSRDIKMGFRTSFKSVYRDTIEVQLELEELEGAFQTLESYRAPGFLEELTDREAPRDVPRRWRTKFGYVFRPTLPRLAAHPSPQSLDLRAAQHALEPGTLMLSYSVGEETTDLFVVSRRGELKVFTLPIGEEALKREVEDLTDLIREIKRPGNPRMRSFVRNAGRLYRILMAGVESSLRDSERLLIIPDGPLHRLPFAALVRGEAEGALASERDWQYLVEWRPLHSVLSATVYAELRKSRSEAADSGRGPPEISLAAFGDPSYPQHLRGNAGGNQSLDVHMRAAARRKFAFPALPYARREVKQIAELFPSAAKIYLGAEATEERAKALGNEVRIVHFAVHGYVDDRDPLDSGLALTIPEEDSELVDNGLLQVWEIYDRVRLGADLVVLSACSTGLGEEQGGEGLIGLTRAFQYAGARSVVAALWNVDDESTAELMVRFYRHLKAGQPKDEALRAAQVELIRGPIQVPDKTGGLVKRDASLPYFWAAFQVIGDYQ